MIYLDWNATTPLAPEVAEAMRQAEATAWANPSSVHAAGRAARAAVEGCREAVAELCGFDVRDVVLTGGGTEANNVALRSIFRDRTGALVVSRLEHPSVVGTAEALAAGGVELIWVAPDTAGRIPPAAVEEALDRAAGRVRAVTLQAVNHETGVIQPLAEVVELCRRRGIVLHCDAIQAAGRLAPAAWSGAHVVTIAAHKLRGPKGIGAVASTPSIKLHPVLSGGSQERGIRPGTQDAVAAAGFAVAARRARTGAARYEEVAPLRDRFEAALLGHRLRPQRNGGEPRAPHVSNLSFPGWNGPELCAALDLEGVCVSSGSACSAGTAEPSPVITAMLGADRAATAVRVSFGEASTQAEVDAAVAAFERVLARSSSIA